jgi:hypothetical protein
VQRQSDLPLIVETLRPSGAFPRCLNGRKKQSDKDADDGDHDQKLDQRKRVSRARRDNGSHLWLQFRLCVLEIGPTTCLADWTQNRKH